jgi:Ion channel
MPPNLLARDRRLEALKKSRVLIKQTWESQLNLSLFLGLLVVTVFLMPALGLERSSARFAHDIVFSVVLISGVAIGWEQRRLFVFSSCVAAVALVIRWVAWYIRTDDFALLREIATLVSVALICLILLSQIFRTGIVTSSRVQGAVAVYLLLGLGWAHCYQIANRLIPGSFQTSVGSFFSVVEWYYYSFETLTTLGYGDIVPIKPVSRSLAIGEALTGQLYLTVLIARLVALEVMSWTPDSKSKSDE